MENKNERWIVEFNEVNTDNALTSKSFKGQVVTKELLDELQLLDEKIKIYNDTVGKNVYGEINDNYLGYYKYYLDHEVDGKIVDHVRIDFGDGNKVNKDVFQEFYKLINEEYTPVEELLQSEKDNEVKKVENKQETINLKGFLTNDIQVNEYTSKEGNKFKVANFSLVKENENGEKQYTNCSAFNAKAEALENLKKGDQIKIFGKVIEETDDNGKVYEKVQILSSNLVQSLEEKKSKDNTVNLEGYLTNDIQVNEYTSKEGNVFKVANFSIVKENEKGEKEYTNCSAFNAKAEALENLKKGDLIKIFGKSVEEKVDDRTYEKVNILASSLVKSLEERKLEKEQEAKKSNEISM